MGCVNSGESDNTKQAPTKARDDETEEGKVFKLLLLGAGGSGKSTVFRQVRILFGDGYDDDERLTLALTIHQNMVESMKRICEASSKYGPCDKRDLLEQVANLPSDAPFADVEKIGDLIKDLWAEESIKNTYAARANYQLPTDIIHYFFEKAKEVMVDGYMPTNDDLLRCRIHSTGVKKELFTIKEIKFHLLDVGGQRNERKKWVRCFENVTAVLYVVALSEYDQLCYEDNETNRVLEALDLFEDISNSEWFADTPIILFLNKRDLLAEKIKTIPLQDFFPDFKGDGSYPDVIAFLQNEFDERNQQDREIISHVTCATNTKDVDDVFQKHVHDILSRKQAEKMM